MKRSLEEEIVRVAIEMMRPISKIYGEILEDAQEMLAPDRDKEG